MEDKKEYYRKAAEDIYNLLVGIGFFLIVLASVYVLLIYLPYQAYCISLGLGIIFSCVLHIPVIALTFGTFILGSYRKGRDKKIDG